MPSAGDGYPMPLPVKKMQISKICGYRETLIDRDRRTAGDAEDDVLRVRQGSVDVAFGADEFDCIDADFGGEIGLPPRFGEPKVLRSDPDRCSVWRSRRQLSPPLFLLNRMA